MDFCITVLSPPDYAYWRSFEDITHPLRYALSGMGYSVGMLRRELSWDAVNIILGLQDVPNFPANSIPSNSILYNFEQVTKGSKALRPHYIESLCRFTVWDYSERNVEVLKRNFGITDIHHVPVGYVPEMECLREDYPKDIDVLFYGSMNPRRIKIVNQLRERGVNAVAVEKVFGHERNFLIARSRLVLNMHYFTPGIFEEVRMGFLFANRKPVVCERNKDTTVPLEFEGACFYAPYESLADTVVGLLENPEACAALSESGHACFSRRSYRDILDKAARSAVPRPSGERTFPTCLNVGSGKDFKHEYLNIDINPQWKPDILLDLAVPLDPEAVHRTSRFGDVTLSEGYFEEILINDVLEHVSDVICTMTNFLRLLRVGGKLSIQVPYDLSQGAWQDPTHIRAFNEMSLRYYTDWSWYVGWREHRFVVTDLSYALSEWGKSLHAQSHDLESLLRIPRAVDNMQVVLEKRECQEDEKREYDLRHRTFYK